MAERQVTCTLRSYFGRSLKVGNGRSPALHPTRRTQPPVTRSSSPAVALSALACKPTGQRVVCAPEQPHTGQPSRRPRLKPLAPSARRPPKPSEPAPALGFRGLPAPQESSENRVPGPFFHMKNIPIEQKNIFSHMTKTFCHTTNVFFHMQPPPEHMTKTINHMT